MQGTHGSANTACVCCNLDMLMIENQSHKYSLITSKGNTFPALHWQSCVEEYTAAKKIPTQESLEVSVYSTEVNLLYWYQLLYQRFRQTLLLYRHKQFRGLPITEPSAEFLLANLQNSRNNEKGSVV